MIAKSQHAEKVMASKDSGRVYEEISQRIGNTPLVRLRRISEGCVGTVVAKLENMNPLWSVKDRIARSMIDAAERDGLITADTVVVEPTSGNTGIGLAFVCAARGYKLLVTMPESMSVERRRLLRALGAELVLTPAAEGMPGAVRKAEELVAQNPHYYMPQQFKNPANPEIHRTTTAEEIWRDTDGAVDVVVSAVGTGGTITGVGEVLKSRKSTVRMVAVEPTGSAVLSQHRRGEPLKPGKHTIQGIGAGFIPDVLNLAIIDEVVTVEDEEAYIREGGRIVRVEAVDAMGSPSGSMAYRYDRNGRLLGVSSEGSLGKGAAGMIAAWGLPQGSWITRPGGAAKAAAAAAAASAKTTVLGYDDSGRATVVQTMLDGAALSIETRSYGEGGILSSTKIEDKVTGLSSDLQYDGDGRLAARTDTPAKGQILKTEYRYGDSGLLVEELARQGGHRSSKAYEYGEDGKVSREETSRDGELLLAVDYIENGRVEELYEDGSVFVKATYIGGRKVKDEFYLDGVPFRTREY